MRIYIHTDLEGISGIATLGAIDREQPQYLEVCKCLMLDLNAAVEGAYLGGATHVTVLDSHGGGRNFIPEILDPRATVDSKPNGKWWGILDGSYDGTFFVGAHAMAGTIRAFLDHTQSSVQWHDYILNGRRMGELAQWAIVAGNWGVPMLLVTGDDAACAEARRFFRPVVAVSVKRAPERNRADLVPAREAHAAIRAGASRAMALVGRARPFTPTKPMDITLRLNRSDYCDSLAVRSTLRRVDARTVRWRTSDPLEILP